MRLEKYFVQAIYYHLGMEILISDLANLDYLKPTSKAGR